MTTMLDLFRRKYPEAPWDGEVYEYHLHCPVSLDDPPKATLYIRFGTTKGTKSRFEVELDVRG